MPIRVKISCSLKQWNWVRRRALSLIDKQQGGKLFTLKHFISCTIDEFSKGTASLRRYAITSADNINVLYFVKSTRITFLNSTPYEDFRESDISIRFKVPMWLSCVSRGSNVFHPCSHFLFGDGGTIAAAFFQPQGRHPQQQHSFRMGNILPHTSTV